MPSDRSEPFSRASSPLADQELQNPSASPTRDEGEHRVKAVKQELIVWGRIEGKDPRKDPQEVTLTLDEELEIRTPALPCTEPDDSGFWRAEFRFGKEQEKLWIERFLRGGTLAVSLMKGPEPVASGVVRGPVPPRPPGHELDIVFQLKTIY